MFEIGLVVLERRFLNFVRVFTLFRQYLGLEKGVALYLNELESPSPKDSLCQVWLKLVYWFLRRFFKNFVNVFSTWSLTIPGCFVSCLVEIDSVVLENFEISTIYFRYLVVISPWNRVWVFIWTNLNPFHSIMLRVKFGWN